jgi:hypothetical protein
MPRKASYLRTNYQAEYNALKNAIHRCEAENNVAYVNYGGRGVTVFDDWKGKEGFARFLDHIGPRPSPQHSLDRRNNDKGYQPGNVWWAPDRQTQQRNRRPHKARVKDLGWGIGWTKGEKKQGKGPKQSPLVPHDGRIQTLIEWAKELDMVAATIRQRLQRGLTPAEALNPSTSRKGKSRKPALTIH